MYTYMPTKPVYVFEGIYCSKLLMLINTTCVCGAVASCDSCLLFLFFLLSYVVLYNAIVQAHVHVHCHLYTSSDLSEYE